MHCALIVTVLNEAETIEALLASISAQTALPSEVIVVDGGSTDATVAKITAYATIHPELKLKVFTQPGNRSVGRNFAIAQTSAAWIACTDAGCTLAPNWLATLLQKQLETKADVVAGYYRGEAKTNWQAAVIPYVLVMPDKLPLANGEVFLPATRSVLFSKAAWQKVNGFNEQLSHNEDYAFAKALQAAGLQLAFAQTAIVTWHPPTTWQATIKMFYRFALGDAEAKLWRPKVLFIFARYFLALCLLMAWWQTQNLVLGWLLILGGLSYLGWAIKKNYWSAKLAWWWLPVLQIITDLTVQLGTLHGWLFKSQQPHHRQNSQSKS
jgi:glycosyltransferase involved in cell wall biosynthesis